MKDFMPYWDKRLDILCQDNPCSQAGHVFSMQTTKNSKNTEKSTMC